MSDFLHGGHGDGGAIDLEFDELCHAYTVTTISGQDFLRDLAPDGTLTQYGGVTNLNMGEVASYRLVSGGDISLPAEGDVALTYVCCAACNCQGTDPQGVARLTRGASQELPMVIVATPTPDTAGFWTQSGLNGGPAGLTYGTNNELYVGNVTTNGDFVHADLTAGTTDMLQMFPARVLAATAFDATSVLVGLETGEIYRVNVAGATRGLWANVGTPMSSMVRDRFTGHVYIAVQNGAVVEYDSHGNLIGDFITAMLPQGRIAIAPDGYLHYLRRSADQSSTVTIDRTALPTTL